MMPRASRPQLAAAAAAVTLMLVTGCGGGTGNASGGGFGSGGAGGPAYDPDAAADAYDAEAEAALEAAQEREAELREAYSAGFERGCDEVFEQSPSGELYYDDEQYTVDDCYGLMDEHLAVEYESPGAADDAGHNDAVTQTFEELPPSGSLCYGTDCYDSDDVSESDGDSEYSYETDDEEASVDDDY